MSQLRKNIIITSIGHFLVHSMTMILPAILVILEREFSVSFVQLGQLATIQILFLGEGFQGFVRREILHPQRNILNGKQCGLVIRRQRLLLSS